MIKKTIKINSKCKKNVMLSTQVRQRLTSSNNDDGEKFWRRAMERREEDGAIGTGIFLEQLYPPFLLPHVRLNLDRLLATETSTEYKTV